MNPVIHVVDDDSDFRIQLSEALKAEGYSVIQSGTAEQFLDVFDPEQAGCVLLDERMPDYNGSKVIDKISKWLPLYPVLLVTGYADIPLTVTVMRTGAYDVIEKPFSMSQMLAKVKEAIHWNQNVWNQHSADARVWTDLQSLTGREQEILALIIEGHSSKTIASRLTISARTVDNHRVHIISKMRAKSLSDLGRSVARATAIFGSGKAQVSTASSAVRRNP